MYDVTKEHSDVVVRVVSVLGDTRDGIFHVLFLALDTEADMAQIVKSTHPTAKFGQKYATGGQVKKYANGGEIEEPKSTPTVTTTPLAIPVGKVIQAAGETGAKAGAKMGRFGSMMKGLGEQLFTSEAQRAEAQRLKDEELMKKYTK